MTSQLFSESPNVLPPGRQDDLTLITSSIGNDSGWLVIKYLSLTLQDNGSHSITDKTGEEAKKVILVSWLKGWDYWRTECRRTVGLDLNQLQAQGRLAYVDGLSTSLTSSSAISSSGIMTQTTPTPLNPRVPTGRDIGASVMRSLPSNASRPGVPLRSLGDSMSEIRNKLLHAIEAMGQEAQCTGKILIILEAIDMLCGLSSDPMAGSFLSMISTIRRSVGVHSMIVTLSASLAFPFAAAKQTESSDYERNDNPKNNLEIAQQGLFVGLAHNSQHILSLRPLNTGAAGDVSGVLRITDGVRAGNLETVDDTMSQDPTSGEWLYLVRNDGRVKIWDRKAGVG